LELPEGLGDQVGYATAGYVAVHPGGSEVAGTGTFFYFSAREKGSVPVLLATRLQLGAAERATFTFVEGVRRGDRLDPMDTTFTVEVPRLEPLLLPHPDPDVDLVALPLRSLVGVARRAGHELFHMPLEEGFLGTPTVVEGLHKHERVVTVGFPLGPDGATPREPVVRAGATGIHPAEDFQGAPIGVVDTPCLPGAAGSPVLIVDEQGFQRGGVEQEGERLVLLGILSGRPVPGVEGDAPAPAHYVKARALVELGREIRARLGLR
jgi:hypothetical protein